MITYTKRKILKKSGLYISGWCVEIQKHKNQSARTYIKYHGHNILCILLFSCIHFKTRHIYVYYRFCYILTVSRRVIQTAVTFFPVIPFQPYLLDMLLIDKCNFVSFNFYYTLQYYVEHISSCLDFEATYL